MASARPPRLHNEIYPFLHPDKYRNSLASQVVVITGAAGSLGTGLSKSFAVAGAVLYLLDISTTELEELKESCLRIGAKKVFIGALDVASYEECKSTIEKVTSEAGPVDVLVNCAGIAYTSFFHTQDISHYKKVVDVNFNGPSYLIHLVLPSFLERKRGCIINIASRGGTIPTPLMSSYGTSKAALIQLTAAVQAEVDLHGDALKDVHVYALHPGGIISNMNQAPIPDQTITRDFPGVVKQLDEWLAKFKTSIYLPGMVAVALATGIARDFLRGRYFDCEHDLEDVLEHKDAILKDPDLYALRVDFVGGLKNTGGTEESEPEPKPQLPEGF